MTTPTPSAARAIRAKALAELRRIIDMNGRTAYENHEWIETLFAIILDTHVPAIYQLATRVLQP